jgi:hypothetical protein
MVNFTNFAWYLIAIFFFIVFYPGMDASFPEILFILHSHGSCRASGRRDRTRDCCVTAWFHPVDLTAELPHPRTELPHPPTELQHPRTELPHPPTELPHPHICFNTFIMLSSVSSWHIYSTKSRLCFLIKTKNVTYVLPGIVNLFDESIVFLPKRHFEAKKTYKK